uniref:(northern house mosquito) hypothetical protein n=1 Tax=Culex pipiens TaxID=7175 RepID=A0A8D8BY81_CULPI
MYTSVADVRRKPHSDSADQTRSESHLLSTPSLAGTIVQLVQYRQQQGHGNIVRLVCRSTLIPKPKSSVQNARLRSHVQLHPERQNVRELPNNDRNVRDQQLQQWHTTTEVRKSSSI